MGSIVIVSLPMIIFFLLLCFASYYYGRKKGQEEGRFMAAQEMGMIPNQANLVPPPAGVMATGMPPPEMPPPAMAPPPPPAGQYFPSPTPYNNTNAPAYVKQENGTSAY